LLLKKIGGGVAIGGKTGQNHDETRAYLDRIRDTMHVPKRGRGTSMPTRLFVV
jgi:hypothetical protein